MNLLFVNFPAWLKPQIIPGLPVRWYGLMYVFAFVTAWYFYRRQVRERRFPMSDDQIVSMFGWCVFGLIVGARVFYTLVYDTSGIYRESPWLIFWPFQDGRFVGLAGMSYHGGVLGGALGIIVWSLVNRFDPREIGDMYAVSIPIGYTFGRLGNFINGELYGRATSAPWGMLFPDAERLPASAAWVQQAAQDAGIVIPASGYVNLPRHPSQLYELFFEGFVTFAILYLLRNKKPVKGFLTGLYVALYGFFRFFIEYFRQPDSDLGYRLEVVHSALPLAQAHPSGSFSTGQILCLAMVAAGVVFILIMALLPGKTPMRVYPQTGVDTGVPMHKEETLAQRQNRRKQARKLRKKLR
jgi:phosphatidylglycerol:prolipoprotein diacylglycerol transferase